MHAPCVRIHVRVRAPTATRLLRATLIYSIASRRRLLYRREHSCLIRDALTSPHLGILNRRTRHALSLVRRGAGVGARARASILSPLRFTTSNCTHNSV